MRRKSKLSRCWGRIRSQYYIYRDPWCPPGCERPKLGRTATAMHPRPWLSAPSRGQQSEIHDDPSKDVGTVGFRQRG
ncbi:hypothetical protein CCHR01_03742 [Colletotrichum chrysophilum]|uniref:Uncharacterized protein n=1 Tax=Colletotrichum chrysophilum TaxID=1836956 RepID=A0AAD9AUD0_9PEZI|nr:hypothetical protein CCHR01_03742 [Colletotrichum chrysophilum]